MVVSRGELETMATSIEQLKQQLLILQTAREKEEKKAVAMEMEISSRRSDQIEDRHNLDNTMLTGIKSLEDKVNNRTQQIQSLFVELEKFSNELKFMKKSLIENQEGDEIEYQESYNKLYAIHLEREKRDKEFHDAAKLLNTKLGEEESRFQEIAGLEERQLSGQAGNSEELGTKLERPLQGQQDDIMAAAIQTPKLCLQTSAPQNYTSSTVAIVPSEHRPDIPYQNHNNTWNSNNTNFGISNWSASYDEWAGGHPSSAGTSNNTMPGTYSPYNNTQGRNWSLQNANSVAHYQPGGNPQEYPSLNHPSYREVVTAGHNRYNNTASQGFQLPSNTNGGFMNGSNSQIGWGYAQSWPEIQNGTSGISQSEASIRTSESRFVTNSNRSVDPSCFQVPIPSLQYGETMAGDAPVASKQHPKLPSQDIRSEFTQKMPHGVNSLPHQAIRGLINQQPPPYHNAGDSIPPPDLQNPPIPQIPHFTTGSALPVCDTRILPHMRRKWTDNGRFSSWDIRMEQSLPVVNSNYPLSHGFHNSHDQQGSSYNTSRLLPGNIVAVRNSFGNHSLKTTSMHHNHLTPEESQFMIDHPEFERQIVSATRPPSHASMLNKPSAEETVQPGAVADSNPQAKVVPITSPDAQRSATNSIPLASAANPQPTNSDDSLQAGISPATIPQPPTSTATADLFATDLPLACGNNAKFQDAQLTPENSELASDSIMYQIPEVSNENRPEGELSHEDVRLSSNSASSAGPHRNNVETMGKLFFSGIQKRPTMPSYKKPNYFNAPNLCSHTARWRRVEGGGLCEYIVHRGSYHATTTKKWLWECNLCGYHACTRCQKELLNIPRQENHFDEAQNEGASNTSKSTVEAPKPRTGAEISVPNKLPNIKIDNYRMKVEHKNLKEILPENNKSTSMTMVSRKGKEISTGSSNLGLKAYPEVERKPKDKFAEKSTNRRSKLQEEGEPQNPEKLTVSSKWAPAASAVIVSLDNTITMNAMGNDDIAEAKNEDVNSNSNDGHNCSVTTVTLPADKNAAGKVEQGDSTCGTLLLPHETSNPPELKSTKFTPLAVLLDMKQQAKEKSGTVVLSEAVKKINTESVVGQTPKTRLTELTPSDVTSAKSESAGAGFRGIELGEFTVNYETTGCNSAPNATSAEITSTGTTIQHHEPDKNKPAPPGDNIIPANIQPPKTLIADDITSENTTSSKKIINVTPRLTEPARTSSGNVWSPATLGGLLN